MTIKYTRELYSTEDVRVELAGSYSLQDLEHIIIGLLEYRAKMNAALEYSMRITGEKHDE